MSSADPVQATESAATDVAERLMATRDPDFAGWGTVQRVEIHDDAPDPGHAPAHKKLGEFPSTAICGNDITSSCLYVAALCAIAAGPYAFICLAGVVGLLYLFRNIYAEVGSALPLNGGAYNALLNTTSKFKASMAACLTILSYLATAVISAGEAMHYLHHLWHSLDVTYATVALLGFFALLSVIGISESAVVAIGIFSIHIVTLVLLVAASVLHFSPRTLVANWHFDLASLPGGGGGGIGEALVFGFAAGLLGISGFESSANFIEEQKPGVFPKTLRNMWVAVAIFNPLISFLAMAIMPLADSWVQTPTGAEPRPDFLAHMADLTAGPWLAYAVSIDAVLVLSGAVLTAYVGVTGLVRRMALDRCLPQVLLRENRARRTNHWIILGFFGLCCSIVAITHGDMSVLAGVYTISFLGVMTLFAVGNMLLKVKRRRLPRDVKASWPAVVGAFLAVLIGLLANAFADYPNLVRLRVFTGYFLVSIAIVFLTIQRGSILRGMLYVLRSAIEPVSAALARKLEEVNRQEVIFFTKGDNRANLNRAALYVLENEQSKRLRVVHVHRKGEEVDHDRLIDQIHTIDELYPELRIDLVLVEGTFGPGLIEQLSKRFGIPKNYMFIGTPGGRFPHNIAQLGGVRLIL
jgi:amino acid transporter